jgi:hypothetical protein
VPLPWGRDKYREAHKCPRHFIKKKTSFFWVLGQKTFTKSSSKRIKFMSQTKKRPIKKTFLSLTISLEQSKEGRKKTGAKCFHTHKSFKSRQLLFNIPIFRPQHAFNSFVFLRPSD